jgi:DNA (cytosine-5)-methyltransferase 1
LKIVQLNNPIHSNDRVYGADGISPTLNTMQRGMRQPFIAPVLTPDRPNKRQNGRRFKEDGDPSFTLTAQDRHGIYDGMEIRRFTPVECARLQGFPDDWHKVEGISDSQAYKCYGNAVTVNVIKDIMLRMLEKMV